MTIVVLKGFIIVPPEDLDVVLKELPIHINTTRQEKGCLVFSVIQDEEDKNRFDVYEEFLDEEAFLYHQDRVKNSNWGKVSINIERHYHVNQRE